MKRYFVILILLFANSYAFSQSTKKQIPPPPPPGKNSVKVSNTSSPKDLSYLVPKIKLKPDSIIYRPKNFYFAGIEDSVNSDSIGYAILPRDYNKQKIIFETDKRTSLLNYFRSIAQTDSSLYPVILKIKKLSITEKQITKADLKANIHMHMEVHCMINNELVFLDAFTGERDGEIYVGSPRKYDSLLKEQLKELPESIDNLLSLAISKHPAFLKGVKVTVALVQNKDDDDNDTIIIDNRRYLQWSDYRGTPISEEGCYLYTTILFEDERDFKNQYLEINLKLAPIVLRNKSWAGKSIQSGKLLNHEHYQSLLAYLYTLKLKNKIESTTFDVKNCLEQIRSIYSAVTDELLTETQKYFYDTKSGTKIKEQNEWEEKIDTRITQILKQ